MKLETFFDNFEILAEAPNGVQKLRELILQLAIQGKLVPQDEKDEPAREILKKIEIDKKQLIQKRSLSLPKISEKNDIKVLIFKIPENWQWYRLSEVIFFQEGPGIRNWQFKSQGIKLLNVANILPNGNLFFENSDKFVSEDEFNEKYTHFLIEEGDLLFAASGGSWGKSAWFKDPGYGVMLNTSTIRLRFYSDKFEPNYLKYYLDSSFFKKQMILQLVGQQPNFGSTHLSRAYIPIPPLEEQTRIVAKVDQLMFLCDELEARQQKKRKTRARINSTALDRLLAARAPGEFAEGWRRISDNFDLLYDAPENVGALRQAILQLAVMGKLVEQDEKDEPASVLLEKIKAEKERLIKEKKIKKDEPLPPLTESNIPHQLPSSWQWISLGEVIDYNSGQKVDPSDIPRDAWLLDLEDIEKDTSKIIQRLTAKERESKSTKATFGKGDVLYGKLRPYLNKVVVADSDGFCTTEIVPLRIYFGISQQYLMYALKRPDFLSYVNSKTYGVKMPRLGTNDARSAPFPLPPLAEQLRIVARVDLLMSLCDKLEAGLMRSQADSEKLMGAVVGRMLAGGDNA